MERLEKIVGLRTIVVVLVILVGWLVFLYSKDYISYEELIQVLVFIIALGSVTVSFFNLICQTLRRIIRKEIVDAYEQAIRDGGKISHIQLASVESLYQSYIMLKGNTFVEDTMIKLRELPRKKEE